MITRSSASQPGAAGCGPRGAAFIRSGCLAASPAGFLPMQASLAVSASSLCLVQEPSGEFMKMSKFRAVPLAAALVMAAVTTTAHAAAPTATPSRVVLTAADNGTVVAVAAGDDVEVRLTGSSDNGLTFIWSVPQADAPVVLQRTAGGTTPRGDASAVFHAQLHGTGTLSATRSCRPAAPGHACPIAVTPWKVTVEVK